MLARVRENTLAGQAVEPLRKQLLSSCAHGPRGGALRIVPEREYKAADSRVRRSDPGLAGRLPAFLLATS
jgi:hypothetical protein